MHKICVWWTDQRSQPHLEFSITLRGTQCVYNCINCVCDLWSVHQDERTDVLQIVTTQHLQSTCDTTYSISSSWKGEFWSGCDGIRWWYHFMSPFKHIEKLVSRPPLVHTDYSLHIHWPRFMEGSVIHGCPMYLRQTWEPHTPCHTVVSEKLTQFEKIRHGFREGNEGEEVWDNIIIYKL